MSNSEFNRRAAIGECERALSRVEAGADPEWFQIALHAAHRTATECGEFIVDAVWERMDHASCSGTRELRAMGAVMRKARTAGWITPTEKYVPSDRVSAHRNPRRIWRSLLFKEEETI